MSASYAAIMNGKRFVLYSNTQSSLDNPLIDIEITSVEDLAKKLQSILSPKSIRRDCTPPIVDLNLPLCEGLRSKANVITGKLSYDDCIVTCNIEMPPEQSSHFEALKNMFRGLQITITGGHIYRDESSRIKAKLDWAIPHGEMAKFIEDKNLLDSEYISLDEQISDKEDTPTVFDITGNVKVVEGESLYDALHWKSKIAELDCDMSYWGQASGYINNGIFKGTFESGYIATFPRVPHLLLEVNLFGNFEIKIDTR